MPDFLNLFDKVDTFVRFFIPVWGSWINHQIFIFAYDNKIIFGLFIAFVMMISASFSGLLAYRLPQIAGVDFTGKIEKDKNATLNGRSYCESCHHELSLRDIFPFFGLLINKWRCRYCHAEVSKVYPFMELFFGVLGFCIWMVYGYTFDTLVLLFLCVIGLMISWIDFKTLWIPDSLSFPLIATGLAFSPFCNDPMSRIWGCIIGGVFMYLIMYLCSKKMQADLISSGDVLLSCGALSWLGVSWLGVYIPLCCVLGVISSIMASYFQRKWQIEEFDGVPFGPAMMIALILCAMSLSFGIS